MVSFVPQTSVASSCFRVSCSTSMGMICSTVMLPSVMVPVLSKHNVSTRASISMDGSSRTSTFLLASFSAATARAMLVSRTIPLGTIPIMLPAARTMAAFTVSFICATPWKYCPITLSTPTKLAISALVKNVAMPNGKMIIAITFMMDIIPLIILESGVFAVFTLAESCSI